MAKVVNPRAIKRQTVDDDISLRANLWSAQRDTGVSPVRGDVLTFRASIPPNQISAFISRAELKDWRADAAFGIVIGSCLSSERSRIENAAKNVGGSSLFFDSTGKPLNFTPDPVVKKLLENLKHAFDQDNQLAPLPVGNS